MRHHAKKIFFIGVLLIFTLGVFASMLSAAAVWTFVDGYAATGINLDPSRDAIQPALTLYQDELYAAWTEANGIADQIRVKKYSGGTWSFVDGGAAAGLNGDPAMNAAHPALTIYNDHLIAAWVENTASANGATIRVKQYDGNSWTWIDAGGLNNSPEAMAGAPALLATNSQLYAAWAETGSEGDDSSIFGVSQIRVKKYDGISWSFVDGGNAAGLNYSSAESAANPYLATFNSNLYITWEEIRGGTSQIRVKKYIYGDYWTFCDGAAAVGLNWDPSKNAVRPQLAECNGFLYATWEEQSYSYVNYIRLKRYNGTFWNFADGGSNAGVNKAPNCAATHPALSALGNLCYLAWSEANFSTGAPRITAAKFSGAVKTYIDGNLPSGLNKDPLASGETPALIANSKDLYLAWSEKYENVGQIRVQKLPLPAVVNSVTLPANRTYGPGQTLDFTVNFSKTVNITGNNPTLSLNLDTGPMVSAQYTGGSGTSSLSFRYTVQTGNLDTTGIILGGSITTTGTIGDTDNNADLTLQGVGSTAGILVDAVAPKSQSVFAPPNGRYAIGQNLDFTVNYNETVFVDTTGGIPYIQLTFDGGIPQVSVKAVYTGGSGTSSLRFRYTVNTGDQDNNGVQIGMGLVTNGATLRDAVGNNAELFLNGLPITTGVLVDGVEPKVNPGWLTPGPGTYIAGQSINLEATFTETVLVNTTGGIPYIPIVLDTGTAKASYVSGSGTNRLIFCYTVQSGEQDPTGITAGTDIILNGSTIQDFATNNALLNVSGKWNTNGVYVDTAAPTVLSVTMPPDGTYSSIAGINFTVNFSEPVKVWTTNGVKPFIPITLDVGGTVCANYINGTGTSALVFNLPLPSGYLDTDGITVGTEININGGIFRDNANNNAILTLTNVGSAAGILVDTIGPVVTSVVFPAIRTYSLGQNLDFTVNFNETVIVNTSSGTPSLTMLMDSAPSTWVNISYLSGSGTSALVFRYTVQSGNQDSNGILLWTLIKTNNGTLRDPYANNATLNLTGVEGPTGILVDGVPPTVYGVSVPASKIYGAGQNLNFIVNFSKAVTVNTSNGTPFIPVTLDTGGAVNASYLSGSGTNSLNFRYAVQPGDLDLNGISVGPSITANGATLSDTAGNNAPLTLPQMNVTGVRVDGVTPATSSVTLPATGTYGAGTNLDITVNFTETVTVNTSEGTPYLEMNLDSGGMTPATYFSGSGTAALIFRYTVQIGNQDDDVIGIGSQITSNGATILDTAGNPALLVLTNVTPPTGVNVDGIPPALLNAVRMDNTHLSVTLSEDCLNLNQNNDGGFSVADLGSRGITYPVTAISQGASAKEIILTIPDPNASAKYGLMIKYTAFGNGIIRDLGGNILPTDTNGYTIAPWGENRPPQLADLEDIFSDEGQSLRFTLTGLDPDRDPLTYEAGNLPAGASFNPATAEFSWTPTYTDSGIYSLRFTVSDGAQTSSQTITLTVNDLGILVQVSLLNSHGAGIAGGQATYAGNGWQTIGTTGPDGKVSMLLPSTTSTLTVRMTYQGMSRDLAQNINYAPNFTFTTVNTKVTLQDSAGNGIADGTITYAGSSWSSFGTTDDSGAASKELLPGSYKFRMTYGGASQDQIQDVGVNPLVSFETQPVTVTLKDSAGNCITGGVVTYAGSSWLSFGTTDASGAVSKELLPVSYKFRMTYAGASVDQTQNVAVTPQVNFGTLPVTVTLKDSARNGIAGGVVTYAGSSWLNFGTTDSTGTVSKELLPSSYKFRMTYAGASVDQTQDIAVNPAIGFQTRNVLITLKDSLGNGLTGGVATYAGSSWLSFGTTDENGESRKELLPASYTFRMKYAGGSQDQSQDIGGNDLVEFQF